MSVIQRHGHPIECKMDVRACGSFLAVHLVPLRKVPLKGVILSVFDPYIPTTYMLIINSQLPDNQFALVYALTETCTNYAVTVRSKF